MNADEHQLARLSLRAFDLYAMSLPNGPNYGDAVFVSAWKSKNTKEVGGIFQTTSDRFSIIVLRRQVDHCFVVKSRGGSFATEAEAFVKLKAALELGSPPEPLPSCVRRRPSLFDYGHRTPWKNFRLLSETPTHWAAANTVAELYFAMPNPDANFASDMQTSNFDSRLWELYLFACFREQGILVSQDIVSPDFKLISGPLEGYVEAVTSNPVGPRLDEFPKVQPTPVNRAERMAGNAAVRFANTLRSKIQKCYHEKPHVRGLPFALALADFHGGSTMVWSREALPTYLYGRMAVVKDGRDGKYATSEPLETLHGTTQVPTGLFNASNMNGLSAVVFSNAATIAKFNRMGTLAGLAVPEVKLRRSGILFDRTPGALEPIDFDLDVESPEYAALWPGGEAWCLELEVFHNPKAEHPFPFDLLPGATHWFEHGGEIVCQAFWKNTVLASITTICAPKMLHSWQTDVPSVKPGG